MGQSVSSGKGAEGLSAWMHFVAAASAIGLPLLLLLKPLSDFGPTAWETYERVDILVLIFAALAAGLSIVSFFAPRRSLMLAASALLFACFGLLIPAPFETVAQSDDLSVGFGAYLSIAVALIGAGAAIFASDNIAEAAGAPAAAIGGARKPAGVGAGLGAPAFAPLGGATPAPQGPPQTPSGGGGGGGGGAVPGWYPDPQGQAKLRYYDGRDWTQQTSD